MLVKRARRAPSAAGQGTRRDAILLSVGANAEHGLKRTNADKRRAVEMVLGDEEWRAWSDREIARRCAVSFHLVGTMRSEIVSSAIGLQMEPVLKAKRHGTTYTLDTSNIGRSPKAGSPPKIQADPIEDEKEITPREPRESVAPPVSNGHTNGHPVNTP